VSPPKICAHAIEPQAGKARTLYPEYLPSWEPVSYDPMPLFPYFDAALRVAKDRIVPAEDIRSCNRAAARKAPDPLPEYLPTWGNVSREGNYP
jgi:hypothetical protein